LDVDYTAPGTSYLWSTGDETESIFVLSEGTYYVNIITTDDSAGLSCFGSDTIHISSLPNPNANFALSDTSGCAPLVIRTTNLTSPADLDCEYSWMILRENGTLAYASLLESPAFEIDEPGTYSVALWATSADGCRDSIFKWNYIHVHPQPVAEFTATPEVSLFQETHGTIEFQSYTDQNILDNTGTTLLWDFGDGNTDSTETSPTHTYASWGDYNVTLSINSGFGCTSEITHTVIIEDDLVFPNVITPNGDNLNDVFAIENLNTNINMEDPDRYRNNELLIYDRWGKLVYKAKNYDTVSKDGQIIRGSQCFDASGLSDGVYYYSFHYKGKAKVVEYNGSLTVIR
jgi:gliding motility-associated-like protein